MDEKTITMELERFDITEAAIAIMSEKYMQLTIKDIDDADGFEQVHTARMDVKTRRVKVMKTGKEIRADAVKFQKAVLAKEKGIIALLEPIETHLTTEEEKVTKEKERIKAEEDRKEQKLIKGRVDELLKVGCVLPFMEVATMSDDEYEARLGAAERAKEDEIVKQEKEREAREEEEKRLAEERAEQEKKANELAEKEAAMKAEQDKIDADRKALENEQREERERKAREAFEKEEAGRAKVQAEKDAKAKTEREALEKVEAERKANEKVARKAALRPDKEKLLSYGKALMEVPVPEIKDLKAKEILNEATSAVYGILKKIAKKVEEL